MFERSAISSTYNQDRQYRPKPHTKNTTFQHNTTATDTIARSLQPGIQHWKNLHNTNHNTNHESMTPRARTRGCRKVLGLPAQTIHTEHRQHRYALRTRQKEALKKKEWNRKNRKKGILRMGYGGRRGNGGKQAGRDRVFWLSRVGVWGSGRRSWLHLWLRNKAINNTRSLESYPKPTQKTRQKRGPESPNPNPPQPKHLIPTPPTILHSLYFLHTPIPFILFFLFHS